MFQREELPAEGGRGTPQSQVQLHHPDLWCLQWASYLLHSHGVHEQWISGPVTPWGSSSSSLPITRNSSSLSNAPLNKPFRLPLSGTSFLWFRLLAVRVAQTTHWKKWRFYSCCIWIFVAKRGQLMELHWSVVFLSCASLIMWVYDSFSFQRDYKQKRKLEVISIWWNIKESREREAEHWGKQTAMHKGNSHWAECSNFFSLYFKLLHCFVLSL